MNLQVSKEALYVMIINETETLNNERIMTKMYLKVSMNVNLSDIVTKIFTIFQSCISKFSSF